ncbi:hypothetical protein [Oceanobacillus timonensis]|uniref:hypothetical protein n=1 Tax=Oceanobacillus timonensis TaxID=1926285 RepID=UPI0009BA63EE|nr:hypothetical protein [Oceanobacillus timonensis]
MYTLVTDSAEKEMLLKTYSGMINKTSLEKFLNKNGYGDDFIRILFRNDLDEYEDQEELQEIKDNQVVLLAEYPAAPVDEKVYLDFEELYHYLVQVVQEKHKDDETLQRLLLAIKKELNV